MAENLLVSVEAGVATVTLNRADRHNAFDDVAIGELADAFAALSADASVRVVVLGSAGRSFSAGADLHWMRRAAAQDFDANLADARKLAQMLGGIAECPKPVVARVQGPAYGGGVGVIAACDIAVAAASAQFALMEVRLGIVPATISPHVIAAIGARQARRYMLTAERFSAAEALRLGLVHEVAETEADLDAAVARIVAQLLQNGPQAITACKSLIGAVAGRPLSAEVIEDTAQRIARIRATDEAREGMDAFFAKRAPHWTAGD